MSNCTEIVGICVPEITVFKDGDDILVLHKNQNSLLKFTLPLGFSALNCEISSAVNRAIKDLDWDKDFDYVFTHRAYRDAVMNIPSYLIGE